MRLSQEQYDELDAIHKCVCMTGAPSFTHKLNWPDLEKLRNAGLIELGHHPDFGDDFRAVSLTQAGMVELAKWRKRRNKG